MAKETIASLESDFSHVRISPSLQSIPDHDFSDPETISNHRSARPWSLALPRQHYSLTPPTSPAARRLHLQSGRLYQEEDMGDTPHRLAVKRQPLSTSMTSLASHHSLAHSSSEPNLLEEKRDLAQQRSDPVVRRPDDHDPGLDITDKDPDTMRRLDPGDLARFRSWMVMFCIVNFDLEIGQALDYVYPPIELTNEEKKNICFSAFPDSNVFEVGDQVYTIRIRASTAGLAVSGPTSNAGFLYGYVFFRQKKDVSIRRGYFQKSLVLISQYPHIGLFSRMVAILGPSFFDTGRSILETACMNIANWPYPAEDKILDLPFLDHLLQVEIPPRHRPQLLETTLFDINRIQPNQQIMASLPVGGLYHHFRDILPDLWLLWEIVLLAEPLVVIAPDPGVCSESVVALVDLILPISYCGDYRPYFTIQDTDFKSFVTKNKPQRNLILGVTNPFFNTATEHWPHIVRVGRQQLRKPDGTLVTHNHSGHGQRKTKTSLGAKSNAYFDFVQGMTSKRRGVVAKDRKLLKMLAEASVRGHPPDWVLNNMLRRYFMDLTDKFLAPLNRYFDTLVPDNKLKHYGQGGTPQLRPFQTEQFLKNLKEQGTSLPFKTTFKTRTSTSDPTRELYSQFLKCGNFATWLQHRTTEALAEMNKYQRFSP